MTAGAGTDDVACHGKTNRLFVDATRDQGVEHIGNGHQSCWQRNGVTAQTVRVARAIPAFVMPVRNLFCHAEKFHWLAAVLGGLGLG